MAELKIEWNSEDFTCRLNTVDKEIEIVRSDGLFVRVRPCKNDYLALLQLDIPTCS